MYKIYEVAHGTSIEVTYEPLKLTPAEIIQIESAGFRCVRVEGK